MNSGIRRLTLVVTLSVTLYFLLGVGGALFTNERIQFRTDYPLDGKETLRVNLSRMKIQMFYLGYDEYGDVLASRMFNGWFLKWLNYYFVASLEQSDPLGPQSWSIKILYIEQLDHNQFVLISHLRGAYVTWDQRRIPLKGIFRSERQL